MNDRSIVMLFANSPNYSFHCLIVLPQKRNSGQWWWRRASGRLHWGNQLILVDFWLLLGVHVAHKTQNVLRSQFPQPTCFWRSKWVGKTTKLSRGVWFSFKKPSPNPCTCTDTLKPSISLGNHFVKWSLNLLWNGRDIWRPAAKMPPQWKNESLPKARQCL